MFVVTWKGLDSESVLLKSWCLRNVKSSDKEEQSKRILMAVVVRCTKT